MKQMFELTDSFLGVQHCRDSPIARATGELSSGHLPKPNPTNKCIQIPWEGLDNGEYSRLYLQNSTDAFGEDQKQRPTKCQPQALDSGLKQEAAQLQGEVGPPISCQYGALLSGPGT